MARVLLQEDEKDEEKMCKGVGQMKREGNRGDAGGMGGCRVRCWNVWGPMTRPRC